MMFCLAPAAKTALSRAPRRFSATAVRSLANAATDPWQFRGDEPTMTKVVCTIGPSTDTPGPIQELLSNGMNVARLNFSHAGADYTYPESCLKLVREAHGRHAQLAAGATMNMPNNLRAILVDTKGPEIRTGPLQGNVDVAEFAIGCVVEVTTEDVSNDPAPESPEGPHRLNVDYQSIATTLKVGSQVLLDDGLIALEVTHVENNSVTCVALNGGPIKKNKGVNLPGAELDLPALTEKDKRDLKWAVTVGADFVAASFIRTAGNVRSVKAFLDRCVADMPLVEEGVPRLRPLVISKIESQEGVMHFDEILKESDGIMVARGDLGVEIPFRKVFAAQKMMVEKCNAQGKPVIVATQMLDSMQRNPRPTRAEVTDVGSAVLDGADAVMLSGETAAGKYPIESLKAMRMILKEADEIIDKGASFNRVNTNESLVDLRNIYEDQCLHAVAKSSVKSARDLGAQLIIVITVSGKVARFVASHRPTVPVLAFCTDAQVARRLQLSRGILPVLLQSKLNPLDRETRMGTLRAEAMRTAIELGLARAGDRVITVDRTLGRPQDMHHHSYNMKMSTLKS
mmetsp:Transcript_23852/g.48801  ORF Transcript_23852/g.48801 Transcript_23852/m.48801 type:complete len:570 (+) Transcript_23852:138-1847(+)